MSLSSLDLDVRIVVDTFSFRDKVLIRLYFYDSKEAVNNWIEQSCRNKPLLKEVYFEDLTHKIGFIISIDEETNFRESIDQDFIHVYSIGLKDSNFVFFFDYIKEQMKDKQNEVTNISSFDNTCKLSSFELPLEEEHKIEIFCFWVPPKFSSPKRKGSSQRKESKEQTLPFNDWKNVYLEQKHKEEESYSFYSSDEDDNLLKLLYNSYRFISKTHQ